MPSKADKSLKEFIEDIPDSCLEALPTWPGTIYSDVNFRLDMQGMTRAREHNLQIQINKRAKISTLKKLAPQTIAGPVLVPYDNPWSADDIREMFMEFV